LEQLPFFLINLAFSGIKHPILAAVFGLVFLIARVLYSLGYWTGVPKRRIPGSVLTLFGAQVPLFILSIISGCQIIEWFKEEKEEIMDGFKEEKEEIMDGFKENNYGF